MRVTERDMDAEIITEPDGHGGCDLVVQKGLLGRRALRRLSRLLEPAVLMEERDDDADVEGTSARLGQVAGHVSGPCGTPPREIVLDEVRSKAMGARSRG